MSKHWTDDLKFNKPQFLDKFNKENPEVVQRREFAKQVAKNPINMDNYQKVGEVEHHSSIDSVAEKLMQKQEAVTGRKINQKEEKNKLNTGGVNDDRSDRKFFKIGVGYE